MRMAEQREFICITCPVGCAIQTLVEGRDVVDIQGQACRRGVAFVREELAHPKRMVTTTVRVQGGTLPLVPVRSRDPLPKAMVLPIVARLGEVVLQAPVEQGQVVLADALGTGVDIITSRALPAEATLPRGR